MHVALISYQCFSTKDTFPFEFLSWVVLTISNYQTSEHTGITVSTVQSGGV